MGTKRLTLRGSFAADLRCVPSTVILTPGDGGIGSVRIESATGKSFRVEEVRADPKMLNVNSGNAKERNSEVQFRALSTHLDSELSIYVRDDQGRLHTIKVTVLSRTTP